jgi:CDP-diacylglycerol--glycerol-3-phosphate 3-phosphatidyltransferase
VRPEFEVLLVMGIVGALSMPIYGAGRARRGKDKLEIADRGTFFLGTWVRDWFYWFLRPIEAPSLAIGLGPLFFNVGGVVCGALAGIAFATDHFVWGGWGVLAGGIADILDGRIARAQGVASARGAFLDSTLDRFAEVGAFMGLAVRFGTSTWATLMVAGALGGSLLVSYARARGESVGIVCKLGVMQRAERLIVLGFAGILDPSASDLWPHTPWGDPAGALLVPALTVIALGTIGTAIFRTVWIAQRLPGGGQPRR